MVCLTVKEVVGLFTNVSVFYGSADVVRSAIFVDHQAPSSADRHQNKQIRSTAAKFSAADSSVLTGCLLLLQGPRSSQAMEEIISNGLKRCDRMKQPALKVLYKWGKER
ncbi:hypothetical protein L1987_83174 [Smallanthus sonchifolius]|uniref:Uncharacterized protein n=1 Tax=Smallanthus sonchifolius TaxID=185202 RepID=A0ACB8YAY9_9ASTR|nr:hypothetical protein L1987_83174 [Smallanthus sonchifolius]